MRVLLFASTLVLNAPTAPDTFAVACKGDILQTSVRLGESSVETFALPDQIFVFSESEATVLRAMPLRHEFENVCAIQDNGRVIEFTAEAVLVDWASSEDWEARTTCQFALDRSKRTAKLTTRFEWSEHRNSQSEWRMSCVPTPVPVYERESR